MLYLTSSQVMKPAFIITKQKFSFANGNSEVLKKAKALPTVIKKA